MITFNLVAQLSIIILPILIYIAWKYGYKNSVLNYHREVLFEERYKLYKLAYEGKINSDHPNYRELEKFINSNIRYAHRMTGLSISFILLFYNKKDRDKINVLSLDKIDQNLDDEVIASLKQIKRTIEKQILWFVKRYSPFFHIISYILLFVHAVKFLNFSRKKIRRKKINLDLNLVNTDLEFEENTYDYEVEKNSDGLLQPH